MSVSHEQIGMALAAGHETIYLVSLKGLPEYPEVEEVSNGTMLVVLSSKETPTFEDMIDVIEEKYRDEPPLDEIEVEFLYPIGNVHDVAKKVLGDTLYNELRSILDEEDTTGA